MHYGFEEAKKILLAQLDEAMRVDNDPKRGSVILRFKVPLVNVDPVAWLAGQTSSRKVFWRSAGGALTVAGIGSAFEITADGWYALEELYARINAMMQACPEARFFVGMSFNRSVSALEWKNFPAIRFILPAVELVCHAEGVFLAVNVVRGAPEAPLDGRIRMELEKLRFINNVSSGDIILSSREDVPDYEDWVMAAEQAERALENGVLQNIVMARRVTIELENMVFPEKMLETFLTEQQDDFAFLFSAGEDVFFGVSPELLCVRNGNRVKSLAILGVCPRGVDAAHDDRLSHSLLKSDKLLRGHNLFAGAMIEVFRQFCRSYQVDRESEVFSRAHHHQLAVRLSGTLSEDITDREFLQALHPSPVVSGMPAEKARLFLQQHEVFDRGWFCGPVGFLSKDYTELAVAARACLLEEKSLHAYASAVFTKGTDPLEAWEQAASGMKVVLDIIHGART